MGNKVAYQSINSDSIYEIDIKLQNCNCGHYLKTKICKHSLAYSNLNDLNWFGKKFNCNNTFETKEKRGRKADKNYKRFPYLIYLINFLIINLFFIV